ncbi:hypothetical protein OPQ81_000261 [Rhizoctonia solani]|nr:hypothetical protein OPQ81_000261 [Rhizoctonia solani]
MSVRSITGCHGCKTMRKKCDETKPECLRCTKRGIKCKYQYIHSKDQALKARTRPAPRPKNELVRANQAVAQGVPGRTPTPLQSASTMLVPSMSPVGLDSFELPLHPPTDISPPLCTTQYASEAPHLSLSTPTQPPDSVTTHPPVLLEPTPTIITLVKRNSTRNQSDLYDTSLSPDEDLDGGWDLECLKPTIHIVPVLDRTADSNLLAFVLQSYAQWMSLTYFDPPKMMGNAKQAVVGQFTLSAPLLASHLTHCTTNECPESTVLGPIVGSNLWHPVSDEVRERANTALDNTLELVGFQFVTSSLSAVLHLLRLITPVFLAACPLPHPPHLLNIFADYGINLKHFATADVALSMIIGRTTFCRYYVPWSLDLCDSLLEKQDSQLRAEWLDAWNEASGCASNKDNHGPSNDFQNAPSNWVSGEGNNGFEAKGIVDPIIIKKIENDLSRIHILPYESKEPALKVVRMAVQECWREIGYIYLYMGLCGVDAQDPRVKYSQKKFMRLVNGIKPGRNPDLFLTFPMLAAGVATIKPKHRRVITSRILGISEYSKPGTLGNDFDFSSPITPDLTAPRPRRHFQACDPEGPRLSIDILSAVQSHIMSY